MNTAKKNQPGYGYPKTRRRLKSFDLSVLRTQGDKIRLDDDAVQSTFDAYAPEAQLFADQVMDRHDGTLPSPTLFEDIATEVMPVIEITLSGFRSQARIMQASVRSTFTFTRMSVVAIASALSRVVHRAVERT